MTAVEEAEIAADDFFDKAEWYQNEAHALRIEVERQRVIIDAQHQLLANHETEIRDLGEALRLCALKRLQQA